MQRGNNAVIPIPTIHLTFWAYYYAPDTGCKGIKRCRRPSVCLSECPFVCLFRAAIGQNGVF